ncbi:zinc dependent phospholipase C family protein [Polluticaenibacter yanchengensis]|uniref:Zinc dependent phospholipase C family protein n=1 Tax=Polluticaenibacter yanchengensis TaxID=3014562 RepID=A0ABT4UH19_9BACT|nr:zinc dependent phospholipase C family protein [Chitinophagaceae bacterium LY-5]
MKLKLTATLIIAICSFSNVYSWGFYAHRLINRSAVYLLPPEMMMLYKSQIDFIEEHAVDPDKRRYAIKEEAPRHFIDLDNYGHFPFDSLPKSYNDALEKYGEAHVHDNGIVPWWVQTMYGRLVQAFKNKDQIRILKLSTELGHYLGDMHVPLHATSNYNGQQTNQHGIHGFWESRLPELFAEKEYDFIIGKAEYITNRKAFIWTKVFESARAADTVLSFEAKLNEEFPADQKYSFEERSGKIIKQYSTAYSRAYQNMMLGMVERRMRQSIYATASFWYSAWVDAGQPDLTTLTNKELSEADKKEIEEMNTIWKNSSNMIGRQE